MRKAVSVVLVAAVAACGGEPPRSDIDTTEGGLSRRLDTGRLIVKFKSGVAESTKTSLHRGKGATKRKNLKNGADVVIVPRGSTRSLVAAYKANSNVASVEIDALVPPSAERRPNDPLLSYQWQHDAILAPSAWSLGTGSTTVNLAICDTGISLTHPDLKANLRTDLCWNTANGAAGDCDPVDWHGTGVAGAAAAIGNNSVGIAGSAWAAKIIPVRISNEFDGSAYISDMADCITYSADKGAHVINLSYGTYDNNVIYTAILDAANYAESKGAVTFVASGNEGVNAVTSQDPTQIVFVGATMEGNSIASWSNYGAYVDLAAPGEDIVTTGVQVACSDYNGDGVANRGECTSSGDNYYYASGTSFASPIAAGAAVVLKALKPTATPADIRSALYTSARDLGVTGSDAYYGFGLVNLYAAAQKITATTTPPPTTNTAPTVQILSPSTGAVGTTGMPFIAQAAASDAQDGNISQNVRWDWGDGTTATGEVWGNKSYSTPGTYLIKATITDSGGLSATATFSFPVVAPVTNTAPTLTISAPTTSSVTIVQGTTVAFRATATDEQQGDLTPNIVWSYSGGTANGGSLSLSFSGTGTYTITARVTDNGGLSASKSVTVNVTGSTSTGIAAPTGVTATVITGRRVSLTWTDNSSAETGYKVERAKVSGNSVGSWYLQATLGANSTSYVDQASKATWAYRIRAFNSSTSALSGTVKIKVN